VVIVGDLNADRLAQARGFGCETVDVAKGSPEDQIEQLLGVPEVDCSVDAVGFEARGHGSDAGEEQPAAVLNSLMGLTRAGGALGIPGLYVTGDPGAHDDAAKVGSLSVRLGLGWAKSHAFYTGQCPVMKYNRSLMMAILHDRVQIAANVNATPIPLDEAPAGYAAFDPCGPQVRPPPARVDRRPRRRPISWCGRLTWVTNPTGTDTATRPSITTGPNFRTNTATPPVGASRRRCHPSRARRHVRRERRRGADL